MKNLWFLSGLRFERSSSPIIGQCMKDVSDTVLDMRNAIYLDKPLIFIGAMFWEKFVSHHRAVNEGWIRATFRETLICQYRAVNEGCFWHRVRHDKCHLSRQAFDFYRATFREKLVSHHRAVNEADSCVLIVMCVASLVMFVRQMLVCRDHELV